MIRECVLLLFCKPTQFIKACTKSYGENCQSPCSPLCINQTCDPLNGTCLIACRSESLDDICKAGTFIIPHEL